MTRMTDEAHGYLPLHIQHTKKYVVIAYLKFL